MGSNRLLAPLDILLVGATGVGKSSTLNGIFNTEIAKVGYGVEPETKNIASYSLNSYLRFHDSAGLGDGKDADMSHAEKIKSLLDEQCGLRDSSEVFYLIDLVLVLIDGGSRDLGTTFKLLEKIVLNNISPDRVIVAINQADMAMKGRYWNYHLNKPEPVLEDFLEDQCHSIIRRISHSTGLSINKPIYYSAAKSYNVDGLLNAIVDNAPKTRRIF